MRKYGKDGRLDCVICNRCGKKLAVKNGIVREGVFTSDHRWDFFSEKDGEIHHFDLCEDCYNEVTAEFRWTWRMRSSCFENAGGMRQKCRYAETGSDQIALQEHI